MAKRDVRSGPAWAVASRRRLLAGVSLSALAMTGALAAPAQARQSNLFSPQWFSQRAQAARNGAAATAAATGAARVPAQVAQSLVDFNRMAAAIRQAQTVQASAFSAAASAPSTVPNGLAIGGLQVAPGATPGSTAWIGANAPTQTASGGRAKVTVRQTQPQALLTWQTFNVGAATDLTFDQSSIGGGNAPNWVVLNRVLGPSDQPSRILGSITAPGKVFIINQNGILFGAGSQVNVNALIAATATLDAAITTATATTPASVNFSIYGAQSGSGFAASFRNAGAGSTVDVAPGAQITTSVPASATSGGGYVMLFGGTARNQGAITTPDGQSVLASGVSFVLRPGYSTDGNQTATTRGSQVATFGVGGSAENDGIITATDGDITLVGHSVVQNGVALATTSVNERGTVHLLTATSDKTASITLAQGSLTAVQPDDSDATALNSQRSQLITESATLNALRLDAASSANPQLNNVGTLADRLDLSRIEITTGGAVEFAAGSLTMAQGGQVAVQAGGRVLADSNSAIDVSGQVGVSVPMTANELVISVQSFEQRDAPVNRLAGSLDSTNVTIDARDLVLVPASTLYPTDRYYTEGGLLEVSGYLDTTGHTIGEWTSVGGTITLAANQVIVQSQATMNISGGSVTYQGGTLHNSYLVGADGQLYNANTAPATEIYTGVYTGFVSDHPRWNVSDTYTEPLFAPGDGYQPSYTVGRDAGTLTLSTPTAVFEGSIAAGVIDGPYQNAQRPAGVTDGYSLGQTVVPLAGVFALGQYDATGLAGAFATSVVIENDVPALADLLSLRTALPGARLDTAFLSSASLDAAGLGGVSIATQRGIRVADGLTLATGGSATFIAATTDIAGGITARGGQVVAGNVLSLGAGSVATALGGVGKGAVTLQSGATIDTRGVWTNAALDPFNVAGEAYVNGGSVTFDSSAGLTLAAGSLIDASAGAALLPGGKTLGGTGGSVSLVGDDPSLGQSKALVSLLGTVRSYGVSGSGVLRIVAPSVVISPFGTVGSANSVQLDPAFFLSGFATYDVNGLGGLTVADDTVIAAAAPVFQITEDSGNVPTGSDPDAALRLWLPPVYLQDPGRATLTARQGVSLLLRSDANVGTGGARGGAIVVGDGAVLSVDPGQTIRLEGYDQVTIDGTIDAPGGTIEVVNVRQENFAAGLSPGFKAGLSVWLAPQSVLDAAGEAITAVDALGRSYGLVLPGGTITLGSDGGTRSDGTVQSTDALVIVRPGAMVDASGASATLDPNAGKSEALASSFVGAGAPRVVASNGGTISLSSYDGIYIDGSLRAAAGGAGAAGGTLALTLEAPLYSSTAPDQPTLDERLPRRILISQATTSDLGTGDLLAGAATPGKLQDEARISVAQITAGGFATVSLFARDVIAFDGTVSLSLAGSVRLYQGIVAEIANGAQVSISAPYVLLSGYTSVNNSDGVVGGLSVNGTAWMPNKAAGTSTLSINADLVDVANDLRFGVRGSIPTGVTLSSGKAQTFKVAYAGFADINVASAGDIRFGTSSIITPGNISFSAAQLYPTTEANAEVFAGVQYYGKATANVYAPGGAITVTSNGMAATAPYSVGGSLLLAAPTIEQGGVIRAPEGNITLGAVDDAPAGAPSGDTTFTSLVALLPGSITSVSAAGQTIPFGGTTDGQTYQYNGASVTPFVPGIAIEAQAVRSDAGATLDLSGGGTLTGAGFQTGRGGSVDTLLSPFANFGATGLSQPKLSTDPVYAIVPGFLGGYAPTTPLDQSASYLGSVPGIGLQVTLAAGVPGLAAGTYTLLPSYYALLPGAFRVELDTATHTVRTGMTALPGGSYVVGGYSGVADTGVQSALPEPVTLTPGAVVRTYSQYDEESYSAFQIAIAAQNGAPRAAIPEDAKALALIYPAAGGTLPALTYRGVSDFAAAPGGFGSTVAVEGSSLASTQPGFEITAPGIAATPGAVAISAADLDALGAARLVIGGSAALASDGGTPTLTFTGEAASVTLRGGATLAAPEVFLVASSAGGATGAVTVEGGATIDTVGTGLPPYDSTDGYYYNSSGYTVLAASNGNLIFTSDTATSAFFGAIDIADGAALYAAGTLAFSTKQGLTIGANASFGARIISLDVAHVNVISAAVQAKLAEQAAQIAAGEAITGPTVTLPSGLQLNQGVIDTLLAGNAASGVPAVTDLTLTATQSVNLFGSVSLSTAANGGSSGLQQFEIDTPAIYGWSDKIVGGTSDVAAINAGTGTLVWNGVAATGTIGSQSVAVSQTPGGFANTGLGSGSGTLQISARQIVLGYPAGAQSDDQLALARVIVGFATVDLSATQQIIANSQGSLAVYRYPATQFGKPGKGGDLTLDTPLLTGSAGAVLGISAGGNVSLVSTSTENVAAGGLGAEIDIAGDAVQLDSDVALPSGRFTVTARSGIALGSDADIDLAGASSGFFDQIRDSAGGTAILASASGDIAQAAGSTIDFSAGQARAGSLSVTALGTGASSGRVVLDGAIIGGADPGETQGSIDIAATRLPGFATLNQRLNAGDVTGARAFRIGAGNLTIANLPTGGAEIVANSVSISVDSGKLTVLGSIDASGAAPGTIDLASKAGLELGPASVLDAHATALHTDSTGAAIDAENTPSVTLTSIAGALKLLGGASIDVSSADGITRGQITLNAPRSGPNDIAIVTRGSLTLKGVWNGAGEPSGSVAVYGWHSYTLEPDAATGDALLSQVWLDRLDANHTLPFMLAAAANPELQARLLSLKTAAQGAFHLRPGVEIDSGATDGDIAIVGDINLANYRYGSGGTEPGAIVLRARGNLAINGSVTDGFGTPADSAASPNPDDNGWVLFSGAEPFGGDVVLPVRLPGAIALGAGTTIPTNSGVSLNYAISVQETTLNAGVVLPARVTLAPAADTGINPYVIPAGGWVATARITDAHGATLYQAGDLIPAGTVLPDGAQLAAGTVLPFQINVPNGTVWPANASLAAFNAGSVTLQNNATLPGGAFIPSGTNVSFADGSSQENLRTAASGQQGQVWAIAPLLPAGAMSWSIGLISGADSGAADRFAVRPASALNGGGNMVLSDLHYTAPDLGSTSATPSFSVIRTGTGDLTLRSGGDITQYSLWGIYTAGAQSPSVKAGYELPQAGAGDGTVLGAAYDGSYNLYVANYQANYPTGGGNVLVQAQGGVYGDIYGSSSSSVPASDWVGNWLWRQGNGGNQPTAWWINFGDYVLPLGNSGGALSAQPALEGFVGIGALGGGNLTVVAGGDAGVTAARDATQRSQGLVLAVADTGRVDGGTLVETGGGDLTLRVGGALNGLDEQPSYDGLNGSFIDLRGNLSVNAGSIGRIIHQYGTSDPVDSRPLDPFTATVAVEEGGPIVVPGDAVVQIATLRDLVLGGAGDAGRLPTQDLPGTTIAGAGGGTPIASGGLASFSLWTAQTAISLFSAGGNLTPTTQPLFGSLASVVSNDMPTDDRFLFPATLSAVAASGSIFYGTIQSQGSSMAYSLELAPAPAGQMQMLARGSIYAAGYSVDISGAAASMLATPLDPEFSASAVIGGNLVSQTNAFAGAATPYALFAFGADTPTGDLHANDPQPARFYAVDGDIVDFRFGEILNYSAGSGITPSTWYIAAKPAWILAGRDIVAAGTRPALDPSVVGSTVFANEPNEASAANPSVATSGNLILNDASTDISVVSAGRDILSSYFYVAGPGLMEVTAGRNLDQQNDGILKSLGPVFDIDAQNRNGGAAISVVVGTGAAGLDVTDFADLYFNPASVADPNFPLTAPQNQGKVAASYAPQLLAWLQQDFGYAGSAADALAFFLALPADQQSSFVQQVFFAELLASGREETDPASRRYKSYVRGKEAIAALFPSASDSGSVTMFSGTLQNAAGTVITDAATGQPVVFDSGISTQFGGDIQMLAPGGQILLGVSGGVQPGSNTGLVTFGSGNIDIYSLGSVLLGQSRIFTTFGGGIQIWSATGDINAGIGTKTSVVYQPPSITYDEFGGLTLAPTAPTNGAGIATLSPVPGVPAGDVDLVAPQGTIDAGEAGIRVSGNLTLAALAVTNAANLQVGGKTVGAPTVAVSNVGALEAAGAAAGAAQNAAGNAADEQRKKRQLAEASVIVVEVLGYGE